MCILTDLTLKVKLTTLAFLSVERDGRCPTAK